MESYADLLRLPSLNPPSPLPVQVQLEQADQWSQHLLFLGSKGFGHLCLLVKCQAELYHKLHVIPCFFPFQSIIP